MSIQTWVRQPTTIHGLAVLCGTIVAGAEQYFTGNMSLSAGAGVIAYAGVHLFVDDNTAGAAAQMLATDTMDAFVNKHVRERLPALVNDAMVLVNTLTKPSLATLAANDPAPVPAGTIGLLPPAAALLLLLGLGALVSACTPAQKQQACTFQLNGGGVLIAQAVDFGATALLPAGVPIIAVTTGAAKADLDARCATLLLAPAALPVPPIPPAVVPPAAN